MLRRHRTTAVAHRAYQSLIGRVLYPGRDYLFPAYARAMQAISAAGFPQTTKQVDRLTDLWWLLATRRPQHIVELGSGLSTVAFARYVRRSGARLLTIEENPEWARITGSALAAAQITHPVQQARRVEVDGGCFYDRPVPDNDFLYVDAPTATRDDGSEIACIDTVRAWEAGVFPATIVIDGRKASVAAMLVSPHAQRYAWRFGWRLQREPRRVGRHTVAMLRP